MSGFFHITPNICSLMLNCVPNKINFHAKRIQFRIYEGLDLNSGPVYTYPLPFLKRIFFCCGLGPHAFDENGHRKRNFLKSLSRVELFETPFSCFRVDGGKRGFSKTMTYQYWIQPIGAKENGGIWWFYVSALHKAAMKYAWMPQACEKLLY